MIIITQHHFIISRPLNCLLMRVGRRRRIELLKYIELPRAFVIDVTNTIDQYVKDAVFARYITDFVCAVTLCLSLIIFITIIGVLGKTFVK